MGFSLHKNEDAFRSILKRYGYKYDSSMRPRNTSAHKTIEQRDIAQLYPGTLDLFGRKVVFSGGAYLRLMPMGLVQKGFAEYHKRNQPVMLYLHPWEFNKDQPKRRVRLHQKILQSPLTFSTEKKMRSLLKRFKFTSIQEYLKLQR